MSTELQQQGRRVQEIQQPNQTGAVLSAIPHSFRWLFVGTCAILPRTNWALLLDEEKFKTRYFECKE
jgi:hypothetical protein